MTSNLEPDGWSGQKEPLHMRASLRPIRRRSVRNRPTCGHPMMPFLTVVAGNRWPLRGAALALLLTSMAAPARVARADGSLACAPEAKGQVADRDLTTFAAHSTPCARSSNPFRLHA